MKDRIELSKEDMKLLSKYFNDLIENNPLTNSQIQMRLTDVVMTFEKQMLFNKQIIDMLLKIMGK